MTVQKTLEMRWMWTVALILALSFLLQSCQAAGASLPLIDGQVLPLSAEATRAGIQGALQGAPFHQVWVRGSQIVFLWPTAGGWGLACVECKGGDPVKAFTEIAGGRGGFITPRTASDFAKFMEGAGFSALRAVPEAAAQVAAWTQGLLVSILVVPVEAVPTQAPLPQG